MYLPNQEDNPVSLLLKEYRKTHNLTKEEVAEIVGISICTVNNIEGGQKISDNTILLLANNLSKTFEPHINYTTCSICGEKFIAIKRNIKTCGPECSKALGREKQENWMRRMKKGEIRPKQRINQNFRRKKPEVSIGTFEQLSRDGQMTYGERQTLERLGMLPSSDLWSTC